ncbi:MAG: amidohydrolase family protein [Planctomycetota bacterium]|nr:amidohydrolase family protein [Planctomycetota bacterium]
MKRTLLALCAIVACASCGVVRAQTQTARTTQTAKAPPRRLLIKAGRLVDTRAGRVLTKQAVLVEGERIKAVSGLDEVVKSAPGDVPVLDLSAATVLPGLIDCHTHVLLQADITQDDYDKQLLKESIPYRTIRATVAAKTALMNGFTAIRDLETEGAMYADVDVKRAIANGVIPGPRMFVATRAFSATGMYPLLGYSWEIKVPEGVQIVDGPDEIRKAVREQVKFGADWIKFYCDRKYYMKDGKLHSKVNFTAEEMRALVDEAHRLDRRVAAHAIGREGIAAALAAGADTIEHGDGFDDETIGTLVRRGAFWCPTIYVAVYVAEGRAAEGSTIWREMLDLERKAFGLALKKGAKIAFGTDVGGFAWTENEAKEFAYMVRYGMTPMQAIQSATTVAAELLQAEADLGAIEVGKYADIIAVAGDPLADITELERVRVVVKGGKIEKNELK